MVKKLEELTSGIADNQLVANVLDSANQIWLAGLGAFTKAQNEGGKIFESLVKEGEHVQKRARKAAGDKLGEMTETASDAWDKLEHVFENRVDKALRSLNVPTRKDIDALNKRVAELTALVEKLTGEPVKPAKAAKAAKAPRAPKAPPVAEVH